MVMIVIMPAGQGSRGQLLGGAVGVKVKPPQQEECQQHPPEQPADAPVEPQTGITGNGVTVRQLVQHSDTQHQPAHQADEKLQPAMGQANPRRDPAPQQ